MANSSSDTRDMLIGVHRHNRIDISLDPVTKKVIPASGYTQDSITLSLNNFDVTRRSAVFDIKDLK
jgi:hypothetical protein